MIQSAGVIISGAIPGTLRLPTALRTMLIFFLVAASPYAQEKDDIPVYGYEVVNIYPHDNKAFTQGLVYDDGRMYESTGRYGGSTLREVDLETGDVLRTRKLPDNYFGEGMALVGNRILQVTWRSKTGFVYDRKTFDKLRTFSYPGEGWGLTYDGRHLIMSDGTAVLRFLDPHGFKETGKLEVYDSSGPVKRLNELEYVNGEILANVWGGDRIARINPKTGRVTAWIDLSGLLSADERIAGADVLNGIAWDPEGERLFVTGKLWPKLFEIRLVPRD